MNKKLNKHCLVIIIFCTLLYTQSYGVAEKRLLSSFSYRGMNNTIRNWFNDPDATFEKWLKKKNFTNNGTKKNNVIICHTLPWEIDNHIDDFHLQWNEYQKSDGGQSMRASTQIINHTTKEAINGSITWAMNLKKILFHRSFTNKTKTNDARFFSALRKPATSSLVAMHPNITVTKYKTANNISYYAFVLAHKNMTIKIEAKH
jgi:hypothetical protein